MPRRDQTVGDAPFRIWVVTVDEKNRIRLPSEIAEVVRWIDLKSAQIECVGIPGPQGGIQLTPLTDQQENVRRLVEGIGGTPPTASESSEDWLDVARLLATAWPMPIHVEANQMRITLPEPPRRAQQLPQSGGTVVVFAFGDILEIWDALKWHDHVRTTAKRKAAAISEALEDLGER